MISTETLTRLRAAMHAIAERKGEFTLFGVFLRSEPPDDWDLVVAAPWLNKRKFKAVGEIVELLAESVGRDILLQLSSVQTLEEGNPALEAVLSAVTVDDGEMRIQNSSFSGLEIEDAVIMRAMRAA